MQLSELVRASIGRDVCNYRRSVFSSTSSSADYALAPYLTTCTLPSDSLSQLYSNSKHVKFDLSIRPAGSSGSRFGLISDNDSLWRSDYYDEGELETRARAFLHQIMSVQDDIEDKINNNNNNNNNNNSKNNDKKSSSSSDSDSFSGVVLLVTHGEMIRAVYEALGQGSYSANNTQVVPIMLESI